MAEAKGSYSSSDEEDSSRKSDVKKCEKKLRALKVSPFLKKSKWYGASAHKHDTAAAEGEVGKRKKVSTLITAITAGDVAGSAELVELISLRVLNKLASVDVSQGTFKVTPLLWAVIHSATETVQLLIERGVSIDRQGYLDNDDVTYTYTPLTRALDNGDTDIVALLLGAGADPYLRVSAPRLSEEEGGTVRYVPWFYPATKAIATDNVDIVRMFMENYDPLTLYTNNLHTCLCFALIKRKLTNFYEIVRCIISYGGKICPGFGTENPRDKGICSHFKLLIRSVFSMEYTKDAVKFRCNYSLYRVLLLACQTDYAHPHSPVTKALKQYFEIFDKDKYRCGQYGYVCDMSQECLTSMRKYFESVSPLRQICRVVIRNSVRSWHPDMCSKLPLPSKLQSFVGYMDEE